MKSPNIKRIRVGGVTYDKNPHSGMYHQTGAPIEPEQGKHILDFIYIGAVIILIVSDGTRDYTVGQNLAEGMGVITEIICKRGHAVLVINQQTSYPVDTIHSMIEQKRAARVARERAEAPVAAAEAGEGLAKKKKASKVDYTALTNKILAEYPERIRLEKTLKKRTETPAKFLEDFFVKYNNERNTIFAVSKQIHTSTGKRRSLGDIFMIMRYYYPTCTLEEVVKLLQKTLPAKLSGFRTASCGQINKRTYYLNTEMKTEVLNKSYVDEYGYLYEDYGV